MSEIRQTILLISNDALLCAAVRRDLETRRPEVRVSAVSGIAAALRIVEDAAPSAILLAADSPDELQDKVQDELQEKVQDGEARALLAGLGAAVNALAEYAPIVVMGHASWEPGLQDLIAAGEADYVPRSEGCIAIAAGLLERRLAQAKPHDGPHSHLPEEWEKDFAEVLRHELNNPLTGILGNAEMLMAEISRRNDGQLPSGGLQRVETIAALAMRMRETVRQLSQEWEARSEAVRSA
ncbi:MAG TPA: histidine kinase dimerization/phospho-acceptor domain-containing protein [Candidatus Solibacter sp.]|nr:histidine kinase dimerization/phospho-acceptor domain-containing protein [Candidatus Solibacter sp.]